ncbi:MAG TPA: TOBE domain-containing protein, partial [Ktedonobacteraceae bacterium]|nr:TOBE domain-containing protein [Ktedonobacteraceae bacterium]
VPPHYAERARASAGRNLTFGIRPSHLEDAELVGSERGLESTIDAIVEVVENLGNELQVYLTSGDKTLIATLNTRSRLSLGDKVRLLVDSNQIHLFGSDTGQTIF